MPTITPTKTFTAKALADELARRANNKARRRAGEKPAKAKSWVFPAMSKQQIEAVLAGEVVEVGFGSGRTEHVGLS